MNDSGKSSTEAAVKKGEPVPIVLAKHNHVFELDTAALENLLLDENIKNRQVVVVSVTGAFRKGKSFLLDFFLRYLKATYPTKTIGKESQGSWMGPRDAPLEGFSWRGGSERDTTGILMWSEVFLTTLNENAEEVAILLLDTQGTFDSESTVKDCATIFALSTMISSIQIYNISQNIQEDDLQHLQLFTEYGKLALADCTERPFQKLYFLVRDWSYPYEFMYGEEGGRCLLEKRLQVSDSQHNELQSLRKHIKSCFNEINCFLLPHPGLKVVTNPRFDGRLKDIEPEFIEQLAILVPSLLAKENLVVKEINGQRIEVKDLLQYFAAYANIYNADELPEPKSMLIATAEANNLAAVAAAKEAYNELMEIVCGGSRPYLNCNHLESEHKRIKSIALEQFKNKRKMGGEEFSENYLVELNKDLDDLYTQFKKHNEAKNIFKAARTPMVFIIIAAFSYLLSGFLAFFGFYFLSNLTNFFMRIAIITLIVWCYVRYNGEIVEVSQLLDELAECVWQKVIKPVYETYVEKTPTGS